MHNKTFPKTILSLGVLRIFLFSGILFSASKGKVTGQVVNDTDGSEDITLSNNLI